MNNGGGSGHDPQSPAEEQIFSAAATFGFEGLLRQAAVWQQVPQGLEARVLGAAKVPVRRRRARREWWPTLQLHVPRLAIAVAAVVAITGGILLSGTGSAAHTQLEATSLAPGSHAEVTLEKTPSGVKINLDVTGLEPAPSGRFYAAWVKGERGLVPIGTFHLRQGADTVVLWSGVDLRDYPIISVTAQEEGAGPGSSGKVLMQGTVPGSF